MTKKLYPTSTQGLYRLEDKPNGKCRKWKIVVSCPPSPRTGKRRQRTKTVACPYREVLEIKRAFEEEVQLEAPHERTDMTFRAYTEGWIREREASGDYARRTIDKYRNNMLRLVRLIGYARMSQLSPRMIEGAYASLREGDTPSGKPLSGTTLRGTHQTLSSMLADAVRLGDLPENPCEKVRPPKNDTKPKQSRGAEDIRLAFQNLDFTNLNQSAVVFVSLTGIRRSEGLALDWPNVDFRRDCFTVAWSLEEDGTFKKTKSGRIRVLPLPLSAKIVLAYRRAAFIRRYGRTPGEGDLVFGQADGGPLLPHSLTTWWSRNRAKLGFEGITIHGLRHAYLTALALSNVPPTVAQSLAGHASFSTTMDIYVHAGVADAAIAAQVVDNIVADGSFSKTLVRGVFRASRRRGSEGIEAGGKQLGKQKSAADPFPRRREPLRFRDTSMTSANANRCAPVAH